MQTGPSARPDGRTCPSSGLLLHVSRAAATEGQVRQRWPGSSGSSSRGVGSCSGGGVISARRPSRRISRPGSNLRVRSRAAPASTARSLVGSRSLRLMVLVKNGRVAHLERHPDDRPAFAHRVVEHLRRQSPHRRLDLRGVREVLLVGRLPAVAAGDPRRVVDHGGADAPAELRVPDAHPRPELTDQHRLRRAAASSRTVWMP